MIYTGVFQKSDCNFTSVPASKHKILWEQLEKNVWSMNGQPKKYAAKMSYAEPKWAKVPVEQPAAFTFTNNFT